MAQGISCQLLHPNHAAFSKQETINPAPDGKRYKLSLSRAEQERYKELLATVQLRFRQMISGASLGRSWRPGHDLLHQGTYESLPI
jgi:hypothetical protein